MELRLIMALHLLMLSRKKGFAFLGGGAESEQEHAIWVRSQIW